MQSFVTIQKHSIGDKLFLVPHFDVSAVEKYFLPKLNLLDEDRTFFKSQDINSLYSASNLDPNNLPCNLNPNLSCAGPKMIAKSEFLSRVDEEKAAKAAEQQKAKEVKQEPPKVQKVVLRRPPLRAQGCTHFIHIQASQACAEFHRNVLSTQLEEIDLDALVPIERLHVRLLAFRLNNLGELIRWEKVLGEVSLKKVKMVVRGVGIVPVKPKTAYTRTLFAKVQGINSVFDELVAGALAAELISKQDLQGITFDKLSDSFKPNQPLSIELLRARDKDIIDAQQYLHLFQKANICKVNVNKLHLSIIGSFEQGKGYFHQIIRE